MGEGESGDYDENKPLIHFSPPYIPILLHEKKKTCKNINPVLRKRKGNSVSDVNKRKKKHHGS